MSNAYMLDTNIVTALVRDPHGPVREHLLNTQPEELCTSIIVAAEILFGLSKGTSEKLKSQALAVLDHLVILPFGRPAEEHYGDIRAVLEKAGTPIGANDLLIAAHARSEGMTLVTHNTREFERVNGLRIVDWLAH